MIDRLHAIADYAGQHPNMIPGPQVLYFFWERGEQRADLSRRIVRMGLSRKAGLSRPTQHRQAVSQGSIFASYIYTALALRDDLQGAIRRQLKRPGLDVNKYLNLNFSAIPGDPKHAGLEQLMRAFERGPVYSYTLTQLDFAWIAVPDTDFLDEAERKGTALLSNYHRQGRTAIDPPSANWLGHFSHQAKVRQSGLWSCHYVTDQVDPDTSWLDRLEQLAGYRQP